MIKLIKKGCILGGLLAVLTAGTGLLARAESPGSIELRFPRAGEDVELTLYQVAVYEDGAYRYAEPFAEGRTEPLKLEDSEQIQRLAEELAACAEEKDAEGTAGLVDEEGVLRFEGLEPAVYLVAQTDGEDYLMVQPVLVPIPYGQEPPDMESSHAVLSPKYVFPGGAVILNKTDEAGAPLAGAKFALEQKKDGEEDWERLNTELVSDENGQIVVTGLPLGEYRFIETQAPEGYVLSGASIPFTIDRAGRVQEASGIYSPEFGRVEELTAVNRATAVTIQKVDASGRPVTGARLAVKDASGKLIRDEAGVPVYMFTTSETPYVLKQLPAGDYFLNEIEAPAGYAVAYDVPFTVTDDEDAVLEVTMTDERETATDMTLDVTKGLYQKDGGRLKADSAVFYAALFEDRERTVRVTNVQAISYEKSSSGTVTFQNLQAGRTYYVGETDLYGELLEKGIFRGAEFTAAYPEGYEVQITSQKGKSSMSFRNEFAEVPDNFKPDKGGGHHSSKDTSEASAGEGSRTGLVSAVKTGDSAHIMLYIVLLLLALAAIVIVLHRMRKNRK